MPEYDPTMCDEKSCSWCWTKERGTLREIARSRAGDVVQFIKYKCSRCGDTQSRGILDEPRPDPILKILGEV